MIKGFSVTQVLSSSGVTLSPTNVWNSAGTTFTGIQFNVTDTASASASLLIDLQTNGTSRFRVEKSGRTYIGENVFIASSIVFQSSTAQIGWDNLVVLREANDTLAQRRTTAGQTFRVYGTFSDASNYRRLAIAMTNAGVASIAPQGLGTGASGNVLHISGLPTSNPGAGILWNDGGTVKVGT